MFALSVDRKLFFVNGKIQANIDGIPIKVPTYLVRKIINGVGTELISIHGFNCSYCIAFSFESIMGVQYIENRILFIEMHRKLSDCDDHTHSYEQVKAYSLIDGEINLIENSDKRVKGTFSYTAKNRMGNTVKVTTDKNNTVGTFKVLDSITGQTLKSIKNVKGNTIYDLYIFDKKV